MSPKHSSWRSLCESISRDYPFPSGSLHKEPRPLGSPAHGLAHGAAAIPSRSTRQAASSSSAADSTRPRGMMIGLASAQHRCHTIAGAALDAALLQDRQKGHSAGVTFLLAQCSCNWHAQITHLSLSTCVPHALPRGRPECIH